MTQKIAERIKKLLNHAQGTDNPQEAETFLAKAMALMEEHQISNLDLMDQVDAIQEKTVLDSATTSHAWHRRLWCVLGKYYGCDHIMFRGAQRIETRLVGRESAIATTEVMYPFIRKQITEQGRALSKVNGMSVGGATKRVAAALIHRIAMLTAQDKKEPSTPAGRNALVTMDAVDAFMKEQHPNVKVTQSRSVTDVLAKKAADGISLARQTTGSSLKGIR